MQCIVSGTPQKMKMLVEFARAHGYEVECKDAKTAIVTKTSSPKPKSPPAALPKKRRRKFTPKRRVPGGELIAGPGIAAPVMEVEEEEEAPRTIEELMETREQMQEVRDLLAAGEEIEVEEGITLRGGEALATIDATLNQLELELAALPGGVEILMAESGEKTRSIQEIEDDLDMFRAAEKRLKAGKPVLDTAGEELDPQPQLKEVQTVLSALTMELAHAERTFQIKDSDLASMVITPKMKQRANKRKTPKKKRTGAAKPMTQLQYEDLDHWLKGIHARSIDPTIQPAGKPMLGIIITKMEPLGDLRAEELINGYLSMYDQAAYMPAPTKERPSKENQAIIEFATGRLEKALTDRNIKVEGAICIRKSDNTSDCILIYDSSRGGYINPKTNSTEKKLKPSQVYKAAYDIFKSRYGTK